MPHDLRYPESLPCPSALTSAPKERRQLSNQSRPVEASALQRDRGGVETVTFPPFDAAQMQAFREWWRDELHLGAAWFVAAWPSPRGSIDQVRRFIGAPNREYVPPGNWRITAQLEVRGAGVVPLGEHLDPVEFELVWPVLSVGDPEYPTPGQDHPLTFTIGPFAEDGTLKAGRADGTEDLRPDDYLLVDGAVFMPGNPPTTPLDAGTVIAVIPAGQTVVLGIRNSANSLCSGDGYATVFFPS